MYSASEIRRLLDSTTNPLRAMILLGINCAFGNHDVSSLPRERIDLEQAWHSFGRPKTGVARRCPLWPETVTALRDVLKRPAKPRDENAEGLVFLTKYGRPFVRLKDGGSTWIDGIAQEFRKVLKTLNIHRDRVGFYSLRRTFRTIADSAGDQPAAMYIMGHADRDEDMSAVYVQRIDDERLVDVSEHVRDWVFGETE